MQIKVLIVAVVEKDGAILLRKKPAGSPPYAETWYIFGATLEPGANLEQLVQDLVKKQAGIKVKLVEELGWDTEVKHDLDNIEKQFVYLDAKFEYVSGELVAAEGIEKLAWVPINQLGDYDNVPPSVKLFKKLGYLE